MAFFHLSFGVVNDWRWWGGWGCISWWCCWCCGLCYGIRQNGFMGSITLDSAVAPTAIASAWIQGMATDFVEALAVAVLVVVFNGITFKDEGNRLLLALRHLLVVLKSWHISGKRCLSRDSWSELYCIASLVGHSWAWRLLKYLQMEALT